MENSKSILIVSYIFPPFPGIGGRRWAKFAKELANRGFRVFVISAKNPFNENSQWQKDIQHPNISAHYLPLKFPKILLSAPKNILEKILYRISLVYLKITVNGNYYDRAVNWKQQLRTESEKIINENDIHNIIVSGAPFHLIHHIIDLKKKYSDKNFIADFRDPWSNNPNFFGFKLLSEKRKKTERQMEKEVIANADVVLSVADEMNDYFKNLATDTKVKFITLENGFDSDDFKNIKNSRVKNEKIKFVFTGTLYLNIQHLFAGFIDALFELSKNHPDVINLLEFDFYGDIPLEYKKAAKEKNLKCINFYQKIPLEAVHQKISESNVCMLFLQEHLAYSLSTKFCEYIAQKKKILVFSKKGKTTEFIVKNNLGYAAFSENIKETLLQIAEDFKKNNLVFDSTFNIEQYSVSRITDKLISSFK